MNKFILLLGLFSLLNFPCFAAQKAIVSMDKAAIFSEPSDSAEVLETRNTGDEAIVSNSHKSGWFKIKTNSGTYGWIQQKNIAIGNESLEVKMANLDLTGQKRLDRSRERPYWIFTRPLLGLLGNASLTAGSDKLKSPIIFDFMLDLSIRLGYTTRLALRGGYYKSGSQGTTAISVYRFGTPILVGGEFQLSKSIEWQTWFILLAGVDMNTIVTDNLGTASPKSASAKKRDAMGMASFLFKKSLSDTSKYVLEVGGYFMSSSSRTTAVSSESIKSSYLGPFVHLGFEFAL